MVARTARSDVGAVFHRVLRPGVDGAGGTRVQWRLHVPAGVAAPIEEVAPEHAVWRIEQLPIEVPEPNAPGDDWPFPLLGVTGWKSWAEVAAFVADLWRMRSPMTAKWLPPRRHGCGLRATFRPPRAAIGFVQEEVRYLAVDFRAWRWDAAE